MKRITAVLLICALITGCATHKEYDNDMPSVDSEISEAESTSWDETSDEEKSSGTSDEEATSENEESSSVDSETSQEEDTSEEEEESVPVEPEPPVVEKPSWTEEPKSGVFYVSKDGIYSRTDAIIGSTAVKKYSINTKVTVVAVTNTDYYKLEDGTFIHKDYLSTKETVVASTSTTKPSTSSGTTTTVPSTSTSSTAVSSDAEKLLNSAKLNPMKTNDAELDVSVDEVLGRITTKSMTTSQKVTAIYDYIVKNFTYGRRDESYTSEMNYHTLLDCMIASRAYSLLMKKKGVCTDYASLFVVMTRNIGLESYLVEGEVKSKSGGMTGHSWSVIKLNGQYYIFDPQVEQDNTVNGKITYTYFCRTESSMTGVYNYTDSVALRMCAIYSKDEPFVADNDRDFAIRLFGNFAIDEGESPYTGFIWG